MMEQIPDLSIDSVLTPINKHRVGVLHPSMVESRAQSQFSFIDQCYKLMLSTIETNQELLQAFIFVKRNKQFNTSVLLQKLLSVKKQIDQGLEQRKEKESALPSFETMLVHTDLVPKLYSRYLERMRRRLVLIQKFRSCFPEEILGNERSFAILYKIPEEEKEHIGYMVKILKHFQQQNKELYDLLVKHVVEENILVSYEEYQKLGVQKPDEEFEEKPEVKVSLKDKLRMKRNSRIPREEEKPQFIYDYRKSEKEMMRSFRIFEDVMVRQGEVEEVEVDDKEVEIDQIANQIGESNRKGKNMMVNRTKMATPNTLQVPGRQKKPRPRKQSINAGQMDSKPQTPLNSDKKLVSTMVITKLKSMKVLELDPDGRKINQSTQAQNFLFSNRGGRTPRNIPGKKNNRQALTMKKPELFIYELEQNSYGKRITPIDMKQTLRLRKLTHSHADHDMDEIMFQRTDRSNRRESDMSNLRRKSRNQDPDPPKIIIHRDSNRHSKNNNKSSKVSLVRQNKTEAHPRGLGQKEMINSRRLRIQDSSHHMMFQPQSNRVLTKRRGTKENILPNILNEASYVLTEPVQSKRFRGLSSSTHLDPAFILEPSSIQPIAIKLNSANNNLGNLEDLIMSRVHYDENTLMANAQAHFKTMRSRLSGSNRFQSQRFPCESNRIYDIYSPRLREIVSKQ